MISPASIIAAWREALARPGFRRRLVICAITFPSSTTAFAKFVAWVEHRPGVVFADPILDALPAVDLTWLTFGLLYPALIASIVSLLAEPERFVLGFQTWAGMLVVRTAAMWMLPLDPPKGIIPLVDPFAQLMLRSPEAPPTRDLFFSGHTATLTMLILAVKHRGLKAALVAATAVIIVAMLLQHVHYAVDILVAPFIVYGVHQALKRTLKPEV